MATSHQGFIGLCHVCSKTLTRSLGWCLIKKRVKPRMSRDEKEKRTIIIKYLKKTLQQRTEMELQMMNQICPINDGETVVAASCGHLFHRHCIINYYSNFKLIRRQGLVECPSCRMGINSSFVAIDFRPSEVGYANRSPRKMIKVMKKRVKLYQRKQLGAMNDIKGLAWLYRVELTHLLKMRDLSRQIQEMYFPTLLKKWKTMKTSAVKQEELKRKVNALDVGNLSMASLFILKMEQSKNVPVELVVHLQKIRQNKSSLEKFRRLVERFETSYMNPATGESLTNQLIQLFAYGFGISLSPRVQKNFSKEEGISTSETVGFISSKLQNCRFSTSVTSISSSDSITDCTIGNNGDVGVYDSLYSNAIRSHRSRKINFTEYMTPQCTRLTSRKITDVRFMRMRDETDYFSQKNRNMEKSKIQRSLQNRGDTSESNLSYSEIDKMWRLTRMETVTSSGSSYPDDEICKIKQRREELREIKSLEFNTQFPLETSSHTIPTPSDSSNNWKLFQRIPSDSNQSSELKFQHDWMVQSGTSLCENKASSIKHSRLDPIELKKSEQSKDLNNKLKEPKIQHQMLEVIRKMLEKGSVKSSTYSIETPSPMGSHWGHKLMRKKSHFILIPEYAQLFTPKIPIEKICFDDDDESVTYASLLNGSRQHAHHVLRTHEQIRESQRQVILNTIPPNFDCKFQGVSRASVKEKEHGQKCPFLSQQQILNDAPVIKVNCESANGPRRSSRVIRNVSDWSQQIQPRPLILTSDEKVLYCDFDAILNQIPFPMESVNPHYVLGEIGDILRLCLEEDLINKIT